MSPEIQFTSKEYQCPVTNCTETVQIKHSTVRDRSVEADTFGQTIATNTRKNLEKCTGLENCGVKKTISISSATFDWSLCPFMQVIRGN